MNATTNNLLAKRYLGSATNEDYVDWAVSCLESDIDSKNIRILAGLTKPLYSSEVEHYFRESLNDLDWKLPARRECLMTYVRGLAEAIIAGSISPVEGCAKVYRVVAHLQYPRELMSWVYLDEGLNPETYTCLHEAELDQAIVSEANRLVKEGSTLNPLGQQQQSGK